MIALVVIFIVLGFVGCVIPYIPGIPLIFLGVFFYGLNNSFQKVNWNYLFILLGVTTIAVIIDTFAGKREGKKIGINRRSILKLSLGAVIVFSFLFKIK